MVANFHLAIRDEESLKRLNFSRDMLDGMGKNLIFLVTPYGDDRLVTGAYDFYSFLKLRIVFCDQKSRENHDKYERNVCKFIKYNYIDSIDREDITKASEEKFSVKYNDGGKTGYFPKYLIRNSRLAEEIAWGPREPKQGIAEANHLIRHAEDAKAQACYVESEALLKEAKRIKERLLGGLSHVEIAKIDYELANVYMEQGNYERAISMYTASLRVNKEVLGEEHPDVADGYQGLARAYKLQGDVQTALGYYAKAYRGLAKGFGFDHPSTQAVYESMKTIYEEWNPQGNFEQWLKNAV